MGIDHAIRNVATLWRASFSALLPSVYIVKDETQRNKYLVQCRVKNTAFDSGFPGVSNRFEWFAIKYTGQFFVQQEGNYAFEIVSDDGARLFIDNKLVIDNDGIHAPTTAGGSIYLKKGPHFLQLEYFQGPRFHIALQLFVKPPGGNRQIF